MENDKKLLIRQVWVNKSNGTKFITIPKEDDIKEGDYVKIEKIKG